MSYNQIMPQKGVFRKNVIVGEDVTTRISANGRIVIPAEMRQRMGIRPGDTLFLTLEGEVLKVEAQQARIRRVQESLRKRISADRSLSNELIAERRQEARREMEEWLG